MIEHLPDQNEAFYEHGVLPSNVGFPAWWIYVRVEVSKVLRAHSEACAAASPMAELLPY
jgi:hypothetical protein